MLSIWPTTLILKYQTYFLPRIQKCPGDARGSCHQLLKTLLCAGGSARGGGTTSKTDTGSQGVPTELAGRRPPVKVCGKGAAGAAPAGGRERTSCAGRRQAGRRRGRVSREVGPGAARGAPCRGTLQRPSARAASDAADGWPRGPQPREHLKDNGIQEPRTCGQQHTRASLSTAELPASAIPKACLSESLSARSQAARGRSDPARTGDEGNERTSTDNSPSLLRTFFQKGD